MAFSFSACTSQPRRPTPALDALAVRVPISCFRTACISDAIHRALPKDDAGLVAIQSDCAVAITETLDAPTEGCLSALAEHIATDRQNAAASIIVSILDVIVSALGN
ncbi:MAG: hypothetical protein V1723_00425 [Candidatus Uhrbacteria bacterium]